MAGELDAPLHLPSEITEIPEDWRWTRLDSACNSQVFDCPHSTPVVTDDGPLMVRTQDILTGVFRIEQAAHVSEETYTERVRRIEPQFGDLVYSREGTYFGIAAEVPKGTRVCLGQRMVLLRPEASKTDFRFLRFWLNSPVMSRHIHGFRDGTVAERLNLPTIRALPVLLPPFREQQAIACILGALDDKIELNRRHNRTLEALARVIFQSWFVDFDPVRAKAEGRKPAGLSKELAALFPDSFEDSELGEIPKGWRVGTVGDIAEFNGWTLSKRDELEEIAYIEISEVMRGEIANINRYTRGDEPGRARRRLRHGDTAISTVRPDRGSYFLCLEPTPTLIASTGFAVLTAKNNHWAFVHVLTTGDEFSKELGRLADGGAYPAVPPEVIAVRPAVIPANEDVLSAFEKLAQPLFLKAETTRKESRALAALRDALLPKLISGELRVPDVERIVGRAI